MGKQNAIAIFDIGKTNKKLFLFNEQYRILFERSAVLEETKDEDDFPCEDVQRLRSFIIDSFHEVSTMEEFHIKTVNFSAYGASFVFIGDSGNPVTPLYNYLKPYPQDLLHQFYSTYGGEEDFAYQTASPVLGNLNSGMQLYRIKYEKPELFQKIKYAFHLPQFLSYILSGSLHSDITSIGCHTNLWDFKKNDYHDWVGEEGVLEKLLPIASSETLVPSLNQGQRYEVGIGLHDSSAALIPYLLSFQEPFVLISTGTWCITLNPFNNSPLTTEELKNDCLCYLQYNGKPVKAARLFAGYLHDAQTGRIADYFHNDVSKYKHVRFNQDIASRLQKSDEQASLKQCLFEKRDLATFSSDEEAYHQLIFDLVDQQSLSTNFVFQKNVVKKLFVDGGFSRNEIYMNLLSLAFPGVDVYATSMAQATAIGTALVIHKAWNSGSIPPDLITLKSYRPLHKAVL
jgi:sugar (pentulose or hexulose) kinase